jgi:dolichyl-phosphate-mannose-protein mannosyltransferase
VLWWRPWLIAAGVAFGAASAVKWSGLYLLAVFAVYAVACDVLARRRVGIPLWLGGTILRQGPVAFLLAVPVALLVNIGSWAGWFATKGGYFREWVQDTTPHPAWHGALEWVPYWFQNWWHYQSQMYNFHVNEHDPHPYQANPLTWLFLVRPTSMYYHDYGDGTMSAITGIANPLIWWAGGAALVFALVRLIRTKDWRMGFVLAGIAAGYLPWMLYLGRTVFQFYTIVFEPFMMLALAAALISILGPSDDDPRRRRIALGSVGAFLALCVVLSAFWYPMWTGERIPEWFLRAHYWLRSWI